MNVACSASALCVLADEADQLRFIASTASRNGWHTFVQHDPQAVLRDLDARPEAATLLIDQNLLGEEIYDYLRKIKAARPEISVIVITSRPSAEHGARLMQAGASDYLFKPVDRDRLIQALRMVSCSEATSKDLQPLSEQLDLPSRFDSMIGSDPAFRDALARAAKAARTQGNVVIQGEFGTGKKTLFRSIHSASPRADGPLEVVRVRAFTATSLESVFVGHEAGAFIGAFSRKAGAFEKSHGGTLMIDEVNRLPLQVQQVLAEALATGRIRPIGASHSLRVDTRVIATSNQPLADLLDAGVLDQGFYEALSAYEISIPPLRERRGDIPQLARHFLSRVNEKLGANELVMADSAVSLLSSYNWPGNARQLQAVIFRAATSCVGEVLKGEHFSCLNSKQQNGDTYLSSPEVPEGGILLFSEDGQMRSLEEIEADIIRFAVSQYGGRMSEVARRLGIGRSTLYRKLSELSEKTE